MDPDHHFIRWGDISKGKSQMLVVPYPILVEEGPEGPVEGGYGGLCYSPDQLLAPHAESNQILDGDDSEAMRGSKVQELGDSGHTPVFVHDFADHSSGGETGESAQVDGRFGLARPGENASLLCSERKDMARSHKVLRSRVGVEQRSNRRSAVMNRDPGSDASSSLHGNTKGGLVGRGIF